MKLHIPQPCPEKWENMNPSEKGRFCAGCQKEVIDFRAMSDMEIKAFFQQRKTKTCGHFRKDQLNRVLTSSRPTKSLPFARLWLGALVFLGACASKQEHQTAPITAEITAKNKIKIEGLAKDIVIEGEVSRYGTHYPSLIAMAKGYIKKIEMDSRRFRFKIPAQHKEFMLLLCGSKEKASRRYKMSVPAHTQKDTFSVYLKTWDNDGEIGEVKAKDY